MTTRRPLQEILTQVLLLPMLYICLIGGCVMVTLNCAIIAWANWQMLQRTVEVVARSVLDGIVADNIDLVVSSLSSSVNASDISSFAVIHESSQIVIGPVTSPKSGIFHECITTELGRGYSIEGCANLLSYDNMLPVATLILILVAIYLMTSIVVKKRFRRVACSFSQEIKGLLYLEEGRGKLASTCGGLNADELSQVRDHILTLIEQAKKLAHSRAIVQTAKYVAHDARKPMALIHMTLKRIARLQSPDQAVKLAKAQELRVAQLVKRADAMFRDIMEIDGEPKLQLALTNLSSLLETLARDLRESLVSSQVVIVCNLTGELTIEGDSEKLFRAFSNIADNALQAIGSVKGKVFLSTSLRHNQQNSVARVTIANTGSCLSPEEATEIFEPYMSRGNQEVSALASQLQKKLSLIMGAKFGPKRKVTVWLNFIASFHTQKRKKYN